MAAAPPPKKRENSQSHHFLFFKYRFQPFYPASKMHSVLLIQTSERSQHGTWTGYWFWYRSGAARSSVIHTRDALYARINKFAACRSDTLWFEFVCDTPWHSVVLKFVQVVYVLFFFIILWDKNSLKMLNKNVRVSIYLAIGTLDELHKRDFWHKAILGMQKQWHQRLPQEKQC